MTKSNPLFTLSGPYLSSYVLVMTAIDRYQAICHPLANCSWTARRAKLMIAGAWTISLICCAPQIFIFSYMQVPPTTAPVAIPSFLNKSINLHQHSSPTSLGRRESTGTAPVVYYECWGTFIQPWGEKLYVLWYALSVFFVPLSVLTFTYLNITKVIWINAKRNRRAAAARRQAIIDSAARRNSSSKTVVSTTKVVQHRVSLFARRFQRTSVHLSTSASLATQRSKTVVESIDGNHKRFCHFILCGCCRSCSSRPVAKRSFGCSQQEPPTSPSSRSFPQQEQLPLSSSPALENEVLRQYSNIETHPKHRPVNGLIREIDNNSLASTAAAVTTLGSPAVPAIKLFSGSRSTLNSVRLIDSPHVQNDKNVDGTRSESQSKSEAAASHNASAVADTLTPRSNADPTKLSKAKIKTIKITIVVIICYISCSLPFVLVQLWAHWWPGAQTSTLWTGTLLKNLLKKLSSKFNHQHPI